MNEEQKVAKVKELFADKEFVEKILELESAEEVQAALKEKGLELTVEEINQIKEQLIKSGESGEEVSDEELEQVAGGVVGTVIACTAIGIIGAGGAVVTVINQVIRNRW